MGNSARKRGSSNTDNEVTDVKEYPSVENKLQDKEAALSHDSISLFLDESDLSKTDNKEDDDSTIEQTRGTESIKEASENLNSKMKVTNIRQERLSLLRQIDLDKQLMEEFPCVRVKLDVENCELHLEGPCHQLDDARKTYEQIMSEIYEEVLELPSCIIANIIESDFGKKYYGEFLAIENITAQFFVEKGCEIRIVAVNYDHCKKAKDVLLEPLRKEKVPLSSDDLSFVESGECNEIFKKFKDNQLIEICIGKSTEPAVIILYGFAEPVIEAKKEIEEFMENGLIRSERATIREGMAHLLNGHLSYKVKQLENNLAQSHVSVMIYQATETVVIKGTRQGITKCKEFLSAIYATVVEKSKEFSSPGLAKFLFGDNGLPKMKTIEMDKHVFIKMNKQVGSKASTDGATTIPRNTEQRRSSVEQGRALRDSRIGRRKRLASKGTKVEKEIYDLCSFTSKQGIKVSWKYGKVEQEKV